MTHSRPLLVAGRSNRRAGGLSIPKAAVITSVGLATGLLLQLGGCSAGSSGQFKQWNGFAPEARPQGTVFTLNEKKKEMGKLGMGPAPYGYWRTVGHPVPGWDEAQQQPVFGPRATPFVWEFLGPRPMSSEYWSYENNAGGRVISIAPHPTNSSICYIASASGGAWKTVNGGTSWTPLTDDLPTLNSGYITLDPSNSEHVYLGTGEYQTGSNGDGIFRSLNGGVTWSRVATAAQVGTRISGLIVHPTDSRILHVTSNLGYVRSVNGGTSWTTVISGACSAMRIQPGTPNTIFVAQSQVGIKRSTNAGISFTSLTSGLPGSGSFGRVVMDIGTNNTQVLCAAFLSGGSAVGVYRSTNGGTTWTQLTAAPNFCYPQCSYDAYVAIDPADFNKMYMGGVDPRYADSGIVRTTDGGLNWTEVSGGGSGVHPDHHALAFGPGGQIWEGNDGGIYKSSTGTSWTNVNANLAATQMYHVAVHPTFSTRVLAGTQDNGTAERTAVSQNWPQLQAGDGGFSAFESSGTFRRYTTYVYLTLYRWSSSTSANISGPWDSDSTNWISPFVVDPNSNSTLVAGTNRVWRTANATATIPTWTAISTTSVAAGSTLNVVAVAKGNSAVIYSGSDNGLVYVSTNATSATPTWRNRSSGLNNGGISSIIIDPRTPANPGLAFVSCLNSSAGRIFRTDNYGANWRSVTGSLPSGVVVQSLAVDFAFDPPVMYVGAGSGIYVSFNEGATWTKDDATFPNVNVTSLDIHLATRLLTVGTYGRGVWRTPLASPPPCRADYNDDGGIDGADVQAFFTDWQVGNANADFNDDGGVDGGDVEAFHLAWAAGSC